MKKTFDCEFFCYCCDKKLSKEQGEHDHGCLDCHGTIQADKLFFADKYIKKLKKQNEIMKLALEFYSNEENWNSKKYRDGALMLFEEIGGERARQALKQIEEDL